MLGFELAKSVYVFKRVVDMRCGFDRLSELVSTELGQRAVGGNLFVFFGRDRRRVKILYWEEDGYWLLYKRLEVGVFRVEMRGGCEELTGVDLKSLLSGMELSRIKFRSEVQNGVYG